MKTKNILLLLMALAVSRVSGFAQMGRSNGNRMSGLGASNPMTGVAATNGMMGAVGTNFMAGLGGTNGFSGMMGTNWMSNSNLATNAGGTNWMAGMMGTNWLTRSNLVRSTNHGMVSGMGGMAWTNVSHIMTNLPPMTAWTNQGQILSPNRSASRMGMSASMGGPMSMPADLQQMMKQFQADRDTFIAKQKALELQLKGATEQQRQALMTQMQDQMMQWQQQHAQIRQMMQDQVDQMKQQLMDHQRLIDRAVTPGSAGPQSGTMRGRP